MLVTWNVCAVWTLTTDFKPIRCWNRRWMNFFSPFDFWMGKKFAIRFSFGSVEIVILNNDRTKCVYETKNRSWTFLTAFECCHKSMLLLFIISFFFLFFFFTFITRAMLVRDAQTRSLFVFLFVTKRSLDVRACVCLCASIWRAWLSELNRRKQNRNKSEDKHQHQHEWFEWFLSVYSLQCGFCIHVPYTTHCWSVFSDFFTRQRFFLFYCLFLARLKPMEFNMISCKPNTFLRSYTSHQTKENFHYSEWKWFDFINKTVRDDNELK